MKTAEEHLLIFEGAKRGGNTHRGNGADRFADRQTRQGEPSGSERVNTLAVLPKRATQENSQILTAPGIAKIIRQRPQAFVFVAWHGGRVLASRLQPAWGCAREAALPAAHSCRNGIDAI